MKIKIIYLLGAGRSGTTLMGTILNDHPKILTIGEMHQFLNHLIDKEECSCGKKLSNCEFWKSIINDINFNGVDIKSIQKESNSKESHKNILFLMFKSKPDLVYLKFQEHIFNVIYKQQEGQFLLDSSKYIARYLLLKKSSKLDIKAIYIVRDIRGVINSFGKQVQTPKGPISTIIYYMLINFIAQIICAFDKKIIKVKYEDFVNLTSKELNRIYSHVFENEEKVELIPETFKMPHIIGGNRMKKNQEITIESDEKWKSLIPRSKQIFYYFMAAPIMMINRYKI